MFDREKRLTPMTRDEHGSGRRKLWQVLIVCILGVVMLGASTDDAQTRFNRMGHEMMCMCGCGQILLECNHVSCPESGPMIDELHAQMAGPNAAGADSLILNWFVAKYGATVLAAPIRGGFDNVAWIVPIAGFIVAIFGTAMMARMWFGRRPQVAFAGSKRTKAVDDELKARIRRETEY